MANISIPLFFVVISALVLLTRSENLEVEVELRSVGSLLQLLIEAETKSLGVSKDASSELQQIEDSNSQELKCIPCGAACISSRNCCKKCYCLVHYDVVIPRCVVRKLPQLSS